MSVLSLRDLPRLTSGRLRLGAMPPLGGDLEPVGRVVVDSRQVRPGDLFWALAGPRHDGAHFAEEAFVRGAAGVVAAGRNVEPWAGKFSLRVDDAFLALEQVARHVRQQFDGPVISVVDAGRAATASRTMLEAVLARRGRGLVRRADPRDRAALPLALLELRREHAFALFETPSTGSAEISPQSHLCDPEIAVINCLANLNDTQTSQDASRPDWTGRLFALLPPRGTIVLDGDRTDLRRATPRRKSQTIWVGRGSDNQVAARRIACRDDRLTFAVDRQTCTAPDAGRRDLHAALAAYAVGARLEMTACEIAAGLAEHVGSTDRRRTFRDKPYTVVQRLNDPSLAETLASLDDLQDYSCPGRRVVVCGELGETNESNGVEANDGPSAAQRLGAAVVARGAADWLFAWGRQAEAMVAAARQAGMPHGRAVACRTSIEATRMLTDFLDAGDLACVQGKLDETMQDWIETPRRRAAA